MGFMLMFTGRTRLPGVCIIEGVNKGVKWDPYSHG